MVRWPRPKSQTPFAPASAARPRAHLLRRITCTISVAMLALQGTLGAQVVTGDLQGTVVNSSEIPEPGVMVTVQGPNLLGVRAVSTGNNGFFQVLSLPPGFYSVRLERIGLRTTVISDVQVSIGRTASLGDILVPTSPVEMEELVIMAPAVYLDAVHTSVGANLDTRDYQDLPTSRDFKSLISILPHINESDRGDVPNAGGASGPENLYYIDGVNVTSPLWGGEIGTDLPYNFIRAVEVRTGGYEAQYGGSLGAAVNAVTYSGTNEPDLQVFGFMTHSALTGDPKLEGTFPPERSLAYDVGARIGGPVVRDKLWYTVAYNPTVESSEREIPGHGVYDDRRVAHVFAGKLDWKATSAVDVELSIFGDPWTHDAVDPLAEFPTGTALNPDVHLVRMRGGSITASLRGVAQLGNGVLLEGSLARSSTRDDREGATQLGRDEPLLQDFTSDPVSYSGGRWAYFDLGMTRTEGRLKGTYSLDRHTIIGGVEISQGAVEGVSRIRAIWIFAPDYYYDYLESGEGVSRNRSATAFFQDTWRPTDRLTLNAGLRWSRQTLAGETGFRDLRFANEWQPRVGFVLRLGSGMDQRVFGSYGRFYQTQPGNLGALWVNGRNVEENECSSDPLEAGAECSGIQYSVTADLDRSRRYEVENVDEFTLGYERMIGSDSRLTIRGIHRALRSTFQWGASPDPSALYVLGTPGKGELDFLPDPERKYSALELTLNGLLRGIDYRATYVLSKNWGNFSGWYGPTGEGSVGTSFLLMAPHQVENSKGLLHNDRRHVFKAALSYSPAQALTVGSQFTLQSGAPRNKLSVGPPGPYFGLASFLAPRGSLGRTPSTWDLNLRAAYELPFCRRGGCRLVLDALHVGAPQEAIWYDEWYVLDRDASGEPILNSNYGAPRRFQPPMMLRFGVEVGF